MCVKFYFLLAVALIFGCNDALEQSDQYRFSQAVQLFENSQVRIGRVACEVGFNNAHYFSRLFKKEYHMLPSAYIHFSRKAKIQAILNDYGLRAAPKPADYSDSDMPEQTL